MIVDGSSGLFMQGLVAVQEMSTFMSVGVLGVDISSPLHPPPGGAIRCVAPNPIREASTTTGIARW